MKKILKSIKDLDKYVTNNQWTGYDPYDGLNNNVLLNFSKNSKWMKIFWIQMNKKSPLNFRPLLGVKKGMDIKGAGLFAMAYLKLYSIEEKTEDLENAEKCLDFLKKKSLKNKYQEHCWSGHYYHFESRGGNLSPDLPDIISTVVIGLSFLEHYRNTDNSESLAIAESAAKYIFDNLLVKDKERLFFKYTPNNNPQKIVYNASTHAVALMAKLYQINNNEDFFEISEKVMDFIISKQRENGSWYYSENNGFVNKKIDFHQGFILDSLMDFIKYFKPDSDKYENSLLNGANFYRYEQFLQDGRAKYRWPKTWPVDMHNQAQGIITFSKLEEFYPGAIDFADQIVNWTIENMQNENGNFYYQKWPLITNKISYMRWSQAWMMLAMATYLECINGSEETPSLSNWTFE